jgi:serine/threonine-protein kinase
MIGTKLAHYEITAHLGSGGMGDVYQATDTKLGRSVAIKFLPEAFSHDSERVARFQREARVLASLNHPNIAAIHGVEQIDTRHFLVMELVPGETLADRIKRGAIATAYPRVASPLLDQRPAKSNPRHGRCADRAGEHR